MRPLARMASWLVVLQLGQMTVAWACSCAPSTPEELVAQPEPIVVATVVSVTDPSASPSPVAPDADPDPAPSLESDTSRSAGCGGPAVSSARASSARAWDPLVVQIEITEVVTGDVVTGPFEVLTSRDDNTCALELVPGETWIFEIHENDTGLYVSMCGADARIEGTDDPWLVTLRDAAAAR